MIKNTTNRIVGIDRSSTAVSKGKDVTWEEIMSNSRDRIQEIKKDKILKVNSIHNHCTEKHIVMNGEYRERKGW